MTNNYTDTQLKQALAKMLPELLANYYQDTPLDNFLLSWTWSKREVLDTELLHLCWLVEQTLEAHKHVLFTYELNRSIGKSYAKIAWNVDDVARLLEATWQQRVIALSKVKGIEIV